MVRFRILRYAVSGVGQENYGKHKTQKDAIPGKRAEITWIYGTFKKWRTEFIFKINVKIQQIVEEAIAFAEIYLVVGKLAI